MATYRIRPCARLSGEITVHSAKNAVLPLMCGALLTRETVTIEQIPALTDVKTLTDILRDCGVLMHADQTEKLLTMTADSPRSPRREDLLSRMRASVLVMGPLLARTGYARVAPGGSLVSSFDVLDAANGVGNVLATADSSAPVVTNEPLLGSVSMRKVDEGGQPIAGATFKLQLKSGSDWVDVGDGRATDTDGSIVATGLAWGTYRFVEVAPAAGYFLDQETSASDEVTVTADNVAASAQLPLDCGTVTNKAFGLKLLKRNGSGDALPGAVFTVEGRFADGSSVVELTSGHDGIASLGSAQLVAGETYTVTETPAPAGYMIGDGTASSASFSFSVAADGSWSAVGESNPAVWSMSGTGSLELAVTDKAHTVSRSKDGMPGTGDSLFAVSDALATLGLMALAIGLRRTRRRS